ncbi:MAG TPA: tripartite tricarboxylate transporter substrate binding protein [Burkholderiales bacterium]|jgi:tripartite-type tricarboxylate transporter receptor subunit TctC|nr:tripartite tricarboxylate transporter substrate binding protein [Burkholderiales bacterium]
MYRTGPSRCVGVAALTALALLPLQASAQKFPERPLRLVVPFAPGGVNDIIGRKYAQEMTRVLGQNVIVENKAGASGAIGSADVARAKPDGHALLIANTTTHVINPISMSNLSYDAVKDFAPIAVITVVPTGVAVHPSLPARNLKQLVAFAKANPGKLSYGSAGTGSITNLTGELFKKVGGRLDIVHVPYKGAGPGLQDLVAGHIPMYTPTISAAPLAYHKEGRIRMLAICSEKRLSAANDIPTVIEAGMPEMVVYAFNAILTTAGTPKAVVDQLHQATLKVMAEAEFQDFLRKAGAEPVTDSSPDKTARFLRNEIVRWTPVINEAGLKQ